MKNRCQKVIIGFTAVFGVVSLMSSARAVIVYGGTGRNTSASGAPAGSGWQYEGQFGSFLGTPIGNQYFLTVGHIGGSVGQTFTYNGSSYNTTATYDDPNSDLRIWKVDGTFSSYAPLYTSTSEAGKTMTVFGRGTQRGGEVRVNNVLKGWQWGPSDGLQSWGQNTVDNVVSGGNGLGQLLSFDFDQGNANEGTLSVGDSGGAVFVQDGTTWKLAGINYGGDNPYSLTGLSGSGFSGAIFDKGGLYTGGDGAWMYNRDMHANKPALAYSTRVSSNMAWINSVIGTGSTTTFGAVAVPEPASASVVGLASLSLIS